MGIAPLQKEIRKILVIKPSSLGDIVLSLPFLYSLKQGFPAAKIHWVVAKNFAALLEGHPLIEKLHVVNKDEWKKSRKAAGSLKEIYRLSGDLKREGYDLVFDLQGLLRSALMARATGAARRVGFTGSREGSALFYTDRIKVPAGTHAAERAILMARSFGCPSEPVFPLPVFESVSRVPAREYAVIVPGARWPSKMWPVRRFGRLAAMLPVKSIVAGTAAEAGIAEEVARLSGGKAVSFAGKSSLRELVELIRNAAFVVTNDSGPMHLACALSVPVFAVFGPTDPADTGPYGTGFRKVIREHVSCSPCRKKSCRRHECIQPITEERVFGEISAFLSSSPARSQGRI